MNLERLQKEFSTKPRVMLDSINVDVSLNDHSMKRISAHYQSFERTWRANSLLPTFTLEDFQNYITACFYMRISSQYKSLGNLSKVSRRVKIPSLIYLVLEQIGYVQIKDIGLVVSPTMEHSSSNDFDSAELDKISLFLQELENLGHEMARGIPNGDGNCDFMMMQVIDNSIMTHDPKIHPVYAFLRSFLTIEDIAKFVNPRLQYLDLKEYDVAYESLIRSRDV